MGAMGVMGVMGVDGNKKSMKKYDFKEVE